MTTILAVDPGKKTGYVVGNDQGEASLQGQFSQWLEFLDWADLQFANFDVIVCEDFDITPGTLRKSRGERTWSLEIIGALAYLSHKHGKEFVLQRPSTVIPLVTDRRLEPFGLRKPGDDHPRDAARHYLYYLLRQGKVKLDT